jgi:SAM-dependent methyltransferase
MTARGDIYHSRRLALGYAFLRPRVHPRVLALVAEDLGLERPVARALDIGAGAGLSTAALAPLARFTVGIEPNAGMLAHRRRVAPTASFVVGRAEALPFSVSFDIVTAAGALNYVDLDVFLPRVAGMLAPGGALVVYDFASGRRLRGDPRLEQWFATFEARYPFPGGYHFDLARLDDAEAGLRMERRRDFVIGLPLTASAYLDYVLTESNVEQAVAGGEDVEGLRAWCRDGIAPIFGDDAREVQFEGYVVYVRRVP